MTGIEILNEKDLKKLLDDTKEESTSGEIEAELQEWFKANKKELHMDYKEPDVLVESFISANEDMSIRRLLLDAIDAGMGRDELKAIIAGETAEEMETIFNSIKSI